MVGRSVLPTQEMHSFIQLERASFLFEGGAQLAFSRDDEVKTQFLAYQRKALAAMHGS